VLIIANNKNFVKRGAKKNCKRCVPCFRFWNRFPELHGLTPLIHQTSRFLGGFNPAGLRAQEGGACQMKKYQWMLTK
jgi:hypothetical protein